MQFDIILAVDNRGGIGLNGTIPWRNTPIGSADTAWFNRITMNAAIIMGRCTWEAVSKKICPRVNIILSRGTINISTIGLLTESPVINAGSLDSALTWCESTKTIQHIFVIGGGQLYNEAFDHPLRRTIYLTHINNDFGCDTRIDTGKLLLYNELIDRRPLTFGAYYFPLVIEVYRPRKCGNGIWRQRITNNVGEYRYATLLSELISAPLRHNRTGIPTRGQFAKTLEFSLLENGHKILPLLTTKFVSLKTVVIELLWFLRGSTNTNFLKENGVKIWDGNSSREFLDGRGLTNYQPGDVGPIYGSQWRNWNGVGIDQLKDIIERIGSDPMDRRLIISAWNPEKIPYMALPPCFLADTYVLTINGYKKIQNVKNEKLMTSSGIFRPIRDIYITNYSGPIVNLKFELHINTIKTTLDHPFYARKSKCGDDNTVRFSEPGWIKAVKLTPADYVGMKINSRSIIPEINGVKLIDPHLWYLMGCYVGGGKCEIDPGIMAAFGVGEKRILQWVYDAPVSLLAEFTRGYKDNFNGGSAQSVDVGFSIQNIYAKLGIVVDIYGGLDRVKTFIDGGYIWYRVERTVITNVENVNVYNFAVDEHSYVVENLIVHNCHYCFQFYVETDDDGRPRLLNCLVNMRSADIALGVPFNIVSYALLTHIVAHLTRLQPGVLTFMMGDCHLYETHRPGVLAQLKRSMTEFPHFRFSDKVLKIENPTIDDFAWNTLHTDYIVEGYFPQPPIEFEMAV